MMHYKFFIAMSVTALLALGLPAGLAAQQAMSGHAGHEMMQMGAVVEHGGHVPPFDPATAKIDFELQSVEGGAVVAGRQARAILKITDSKSGLPVSGQPVAGWMMLRRNSQVAAELSCKAKAKMFTQGRVTARADVDLNASKLLILNRDGTIGIANPKVDFTITQLESVIPLPGVPADWAMAADLQTLLVSLPIYSSVAVVDTHKRQITGLIELAKGTLPTQLQPLPDGRVAIFLSGTASVTIAGVDGTQPAAPVAVGKGPVTMTPGGDDTLFVATADGNLMAIDLKTGKTLASTKIPTGEPSLAWSPQSKRLYATATDSGEIAVLDPVTLTTLHRIAVTPGVFTMVMEPEGRYLLALNRTTSKLLLFDSQTDTISAEKSVARSPVEIGFSHEYAYIRGLEGDYFSVVELAELRSGRIIPVHVQSAARPVVKREALARAKLIVPYGHGVLVGNVDEAVAYYYMEGMNSPMGTVKTYGPNVQGLMALDRGFRQTAPGVFETTTVLPHGGTYDIPIAIDSPDFVTCFTAEAQAAPRIETAETRAAIRVESESVPNFSAKMPGRVLFRIVNNETNKPAVGLKDVRLLAFSSSGTWQVRKLAVEVGDGRYTSEWIFPRSGRYGLSVEVASHDLHFADRQPMYLKVEGSKTASTDKEDNTL